MGAWVYPTAGDNVLDRDVVKLHQIPFYVHSMASGRARESAPLLHKPRHQAKMNGKRQLVLRRQRDSWQEEEDQEEKAKDREIFAENMNRGASLLFQDSLVLFLQLLQVRFNHVHTIVL